ncbi:zinc finger dihydrouridine synthase [Mycena metata]|uniref:tRNA-dihydrouridine(47) synthase [NAD(P)(+)] n=1 Tax=Mycena metata TaxID=1033252 RepID=A0AAD7MAQ4_9AGAR|nr:zinc finger dihydrouridine synthase [Mycena metata]
MLPAGTAQVKAEFLLSVNPTTSVPDDDAAEGSTSHVRGGAPSEDQQEDTRSTGPARGKWTKEKKKAQSGMNKGRRFGKVRDEVDLCYRVASGRICDFGDKCRNNHDLAGYLAAKPPDLRFPEPEEVQSMPVPVIGQMDVDGDAEASAASDLKTICPVFAETGDCRFGFRCRYLGGHVRYTDAGVAELVKDEEKMAYSAALGSGEVNRITNDAQKLLRSKKYPFPIATAYQKELEATDAANSKPKPKPSAIVISEPDQDQDMDGVGAPVEVPPQPKPSVDELIEKRTGDSVAPVDAPDARTRFSEKKRLDWAGKTYLAPLTTVGNLPFRRLCVSYGADITCGEMGLANSFLAGSKEEWSLVRRHPSEKTFGVQLAGSKVLSLVSTAEVLAKECGNTIDFVDLNCGCPIDLVFKTGSGSALLDNVNRLGKIVFGMSRALGEIPVTVKLRTGVKDGKNNAHKFMPRLGPEFNASCITLHGRTRQQRYTKLADWDYIKECVDAVRAREADEDLPRIPIFGGGDCFSSQDYWSCVEQSGVDGVMAARGALIKPWIFTEIKEHREWDISARERLEGIRRYAEYGLTHFGTDTAGVNSTRRYLCEALSFQYRYVPIGLLERLPARINDRAPAFRGRDELETLLASGDSRDWVRISEMFLGRAPEAWSFTPKHKSNAYESQG